MVLEVIDARRRLPRKRLAIVTLILTAMIQAGQAMSADASPASEHEPLIRVWNDLQLGRWQPDALCSIPIPAECLQWRALGIWICPLGKMRLYDWIAERGAPGVLSHLWVTKP